MFTGLVQAVGRVARVQPRCKGIRLSIDPRPWAHRPRPGDSISIGGVCLTVAAVSRSRKSKNAPVLAFDVIPETLSKTTLGVLAPGSRVNLEHAATPETLLGGHIVQGHVDGIGSVAKVQRGDDWRVWINVPTKGQANLAQYVVPKGSICIDGVSLTVADLSPTGFQVALIPTTLEKTTLADLHPGDNVNIEADIMAKTVVFWLKNFGKRRSKSENSSATPV